MGLPAMNGDMDGIERECVRRIAQEKGIPEESILPESTLEALAIDSLDRVSLSFDLEEQYAVVIPESRLHALRTVGDVVAAVSEALAKKRAASQPGATAT